MAFLMNKEKALELLKELLELEEKNDIGNLTRRERAEFQSIIQEMTEEKEAEFISIDIPEGTLKAGKSCDIDNPGIYVELYPENLDYPIDIALIEHNELCNNLATIVWNDAMQEDYTNKLVLQNLKECIEFIKEAERE